MNRYFSLRDEVLHLLDEKSHGYYKRDAIAHIKMDPVKRTR